MKHHGLAPTIGDPQPSRCRRPAVLAALALLLIACDDTRDGGSRCVDCGIDVRPANTTCLAVPPPPELAEAVIAYPRLQSGEEPTLLTRPAASRHFFVVERAGRLRRFEDRPDAASAPVVLDIASDVDADGDGGLVAAAFHPRFAHNGLVYLSYTARGGTVTRSRVERFRSTDGGASFVLGSRRILIDLDQTDPGRIHLNADMRFGPDGLLYIGFGDGGPQGDPRGNAQDLESLLGKILRIDVDRGDPYGIPGDNPFVESGGGRPEVFALGLRNPWRFSFDAATGIMWVGDVGWSSWEELNQVRSGTNLGWPSFEGSTCAAPSGCDRIRQVPPFAEYATEGGAAVVGGFVYRGKALPALAGRYIYGDYVRGEVWAVDSLGGRELVARTGLRIVSFAEDAGGELLIVDFASGRLFRLQPQAPSQRALPERLSRTGCFVPSDPRQPAVGLVPYDVRVPFWSDGAVKRRFVALPDAQTARIRQDGSIAFPVGTVLVKEFFLGNRPIETRLLMRYREGQWTGASYVWDPDGSDARLVADGDMLTLAHDGVAWSYPSRATCLVCHNSDRALGLEIAQIGGRPGSTSAGVSQLDTLRRLGILAGTAPPGRPLPRDTEMASIDERARAYLHVNCGACHTRDGPTPVDMDLRFTAPLGEMKICDVRPSEGDLGIRNARRLAPGSPDRSLISRRMHAIGADHMPPVGPRLVDERGTAVVDAWIGGLRDCR